MFEGIIPKLRKDLEIRPINHENEELILLYDRKSLAKNPILITPAMFTILYLLEENLTVEKFQELFKNEFKIDNVDNILQQIKELDDLGFLESEKFRKLQKEDENQYHNLPFRPMITAGNSFPAEANEFVSFMENLFSKLNTKNSRTNYNGVVAPHLDLSLEDYSHRVYAAAYNAIKDTNADTYIIFGTSHFAFSSYFMLTEKPYNTPLGNLEIDLELQKRVFEETNKEFGDNYLNLLRLRQIDEQAHRWEHSIEYAALFVKYLNQNRNIKILPILVGSFHEFLITKKQPISESLLTKFFDILHRIAKESGKKVCWISSVDFSHIGKKFGDHFDAIDKLEECEHEDKISINALTSLKPDLFFEKAILDQDKWKICGLSPIYAQFYAMKPSKVEFLDYNQWYEKETKSAVTIAALGLD